MELCLAIEITTESKKLIEKETTKIFDDHKEYLWFDPQEYRIPLFIWNKVDEDLIPKLIQKISDVLFDSREFEIFASDYVVKIGSRIDLFLKFQREAKFTKIVRELADGFYGSGTACPDEFAMIALARYKIPSKQQYSHLKNQLEKINSDVHVSVKSLSIVKMTEFGNGAKEGEVITNVELQKGN